MGETREVGATVVEATVAHNHDAGEDGPNGMATSISKRSTAPALFARAATRFWKKLQQTDSCWRWLGSLDRDGYGLHSIGRRTIRAHRFSYWLHFGDPGDQIVMHVCDTPACVHPGHLRLGTTLDNVRDKIAKGRLRVPHGDEHWSRKFSHRDVVRIRALWATGEWTQTAIAKRYGVSLTTIHRAIRHKTWEESNGRTPH